MKTIKRTSIFLMLVCALPMLMAQSNDVPTDIVSALNKGDAAKLSTYLNASVELIVEKKNDVFSKQQASAIIADFFKRNKVTSFQTIHKGNKESAGFLIGTLKTDNGNYRVYVLTRLVNKKSLIQQLRIEPTNE